ncbi:MAG: hypothetical protein AAFX79_00965 [Planctomycetota bacterium]
MPRCIAGIVVLLFGMAASGQTLPTYGHDFVVIGAPGNRAATPAEAPDWSGAPLGAVDYEFRITRTEVTKIQFAEFVNAYIRTPGAATAGGWIGPGLTVTRFDPEGFPIWEPWMGFELHRWSRHPEPASSLESACLD